MSTNAPPRRRHESSDSTSLDNPDPPHHMSSSTSSHPHRYHPQTRYELPVAADDSSIQSSVRSTSSHMADSITRKLQRQQLQLQRWCPSLKICFDGFNRLPRGLKMSVLLLWLVWKVSITLLVLYYMIFPFGTARPATVRGVDPSSAMMEPPSLSSSIKLLYIVTSLAEYNTGTRATKKGQDRLAEVMLPVLVDSVEQLLSTPTTTMTTTEQYEPYDVDVYLILHYELKPEREQEIRQRLPAGVGLEVWDDASPLGYDKKDGKQVIQDNTRALARQHRYVIRDKLTEYDSFIILEDDMRITQHHVHHFLQMSNQLQMLQQQSPLSSSVVEPMEDPYNMKFDGKMTQHQLKRLMPGFIRVEVLLDEATNGAQTKLDPVEVDLQFPVRETTQESSNMYNNPYDAESHAGNAGADNKAIENNSRKQLDEEEKDENRHIDPQICCHVPNMKPNIETPTEPNYQDVVIWETAIRAMAVRQLVPKHKDENSSVSSSSSLSSMIDWVALLPGPGKHLKAEEKIGGFWSGRVNHKNGDASSSSSPLFDDNAGYPTGGMPKLIAQQGGWIATQEQIYRLNDDLCMGSFLPPFDQDVYHMDGQEAMNVEFWSGGFQLFTGVKGGCNMQRVVSLDPNHFSKHLLYHVANNKQRQLTRQRMLRADNLFGQLNTVKKAAERLQLQNKSSSKVSRVQ